MRWVITSGQRCLQRSGHGYVQLTQKGKRACRAPAARRRRNVEIDAAKGRNLELAQTMSGGREGSLCLSSTAQLPVRAGVC